MKNFFILIIFSLAMSSIFFTNIKTAPTARSEMASTSVKDKIYVAGGINFWGSNNSFEVYDIQSKTWEKLPSLPEKLNHVGMSSWKDTIYISGGFYNARQTKFSNLLYAYSIKNRKWSILSKMPAKRGAHFMIQRNHYLHLIGGRNHQAIWTYDLKNRKWLKDIISPLPEKRDHISVLQNDKKLYIVGGRHGGVTKEDCWAYDFNSKQWKLITNLATPRGGQAACLINNQIHIIGGEDLVDQKTFARHDVYDLLNQTWTRGKDLHIPRHGFIGELYQNQWYIFGGGKKAGVKTLISATANLEILDL